MLAVFVLKNMSVPFPYGSSDPGHLATGPVGQAAYMPSSQMPYTPSSQMPYMPSSQMPYMPSSQMPYMPSSQMPYMPSSQSPNTQAGQPSYMPSSQSPNTQPGQPPYMPSSQLPYTQPGQPSYMPSSQPSYMPSSQPSYMPSSQPSYMPSSQQQVGQQQAGPQQVGQQQPHLASVATTSYGIKQIKNAEGVVTHVSVHLKKGEHQHMMEHSDSHNEQEMQQRITRDVYLKTKHVPAMRAFFENGNHVTFEQEHNYEPSGRKPDHNYMRLLGLDFHTQNAVNSNEHVKNLFADVHHDAKQYAKGEAYTKPIFHQTHTVEQQQQHKEITAHQKRDHPAMAPEVWDKFENKAYQNAHFQTGLKPLDDMGLYVVSHPWWQHVENLFTGKPAPARVSHRLKARKDTDADIERSRVAQESQYHPHPVDWSLLHHLENLKIRV